jgi:hypothetical protein
MTPIDALKEAMKQAVNYDGLDLSTIGPKHWYSIARAVIAEAAQQEGATDTDIRVLRDANLALAMESHELQEALANLYAQVKKFCEEQGEADFETHEALALLHRLRPLEYARPFQSAAQQQEPERVFLHYCPMCKASRSGEIRKAESWRMGAPCEEELQTRLL